MFFRVVNFSKICGLHNVAARRYHADIHALSHYWLNRFQLTEHDLASISVTLQPVTVMHKLEQSWKNVSSFLLLSSFFLLFLIQPSFSMNQERHVCRRGCRPAAWNSSLLVLCCVNQVSWAVTTSREPLSHHLSTALCSLFTQMKQAQTISSYKIRNCIWQFLNKCIQVQLKAF